VTPNDNSSNDGKLLSIDADVASGTGPSRKATPISRHSLFFEIAVVSTISMDADGV
jgi:hypothetical protein